MKTLIRLNRLNVPIVSMEKAIISRARRHGGYNRMIAGMPSRIVLD